MSEYVSQKYIQEHLDELLDDGLRFIVEELRAKQWESGLTMRPVLRSADEVKPSVITEALANGFRDIFIRNGVDEVTATRVINMIRKDANPFMVTIKGKSLYLSFVPVSWSYYVPLNPDDEDDDRYVIKWYVEFTPIFKKNAVRNQKEAD